MSCLAAAILALSLQGPIRPHEHVERSSSRPPILLSESWDDLSPPQRDRAMRNYQRYMDLPAEKRRDIDQRYEKWKKLPSDDKDRMRQKHEDYKRRMGFAGDD